MTVKAYIASAAIDPNNPKQAPLPAEVTQGHHKHLCSTQEIASGDSATSTMKFGSIPSNARISRNSVLDHDAITSTTSFDIGLGKTVSGVYTAQSVNCLLAASDIHLAGSKALSAIDIASLPLPAWQVAGYSADPGGRLDVVGTINVAATAAGTVTLTLDYAVP